MLAVVQPEERVEITEVDPQVGPIEIRQAKANKLFRKVGKWTVAGFFAALGASVPLGATGVFLIHQFNDTVVDPASIKLDENGHLIRGGLDNNANGANELNKSISGGVDVRITIPPVTTVSAVPGEAGGQTEEAPPITITIGNDVAAPPPPDTPAESTTTTSLTPPPVTTTP